MHFHLWDSHEALTQEDAGRWYHEQRVFVFARAAANPKGVKRKRNPKAKGEKTVVLKRATTCALTVALDNSLRQGTTVGLVVFLQQEGDATTPLPLRRVLVLHFDEGSPNLAFAYWALYKAKMRAIAVRDIYHREWNDCSMALKAANLWHIVLLLSLVCNLPYGPWDGSGWWSKMLESAKDLAKKDKLGGPLFERLYAGMCEDKAERPTASPAHKRKMFEELLEAFFKKGPRVALKRWFSFFDGAEFLDGVWHSRLLCMLYIGIATKTYKHYSKTPLWAAPQAGQAVVGDSDDDEEEEKEKASAGSIAPAAAAASVAAGEGEEQETEKKAVKQGDDSIQSLRRRCNNSLFVGCHILSQTDLRGQARLLCALIKPVYNQHSENARSCRAEDEVLSYYVRQAKGAVWGVLAEVLAVLRDMPTLRSVGFTTDMDRFKRATVDAHEPLLVVEDAFAKQAWNLACHLVRFRFGSMSWHFASWPGQLALFASDSADDRGVVLRTWRADWNAFQAASEHAPVSPFLDQLVRRSPFRTVAMSEVAEYACAEGAPDDEEVTRTLAQFAKNVFSGFGQSKVVEDAFQKARDREGYDVKNRRRELARRWANLGDMGVLRLHERADIDPESRSVEDLPKLTKQVFNLVRQPPSIDTSSLVGKLTWPSLTAQGGQALGVDAALFALCERTDDWAKASGCWKSIFVPAPSVALEKTSGRYFLFCGLVGGMAHVALELERHPGKHGDVLFAVKVGPTCSASFKFVFDWEDYTIVPVNFVCPARQFTLQGFRLSGMMGAMIVEKGARLSILQHAARNAFWKLDATVMKRALLDLGVAAPTDPTEYGIVEALLLRILEGVPAETIAEILALRGVTAPKVMPDIPDEVLDNLAGKEEVEKIKAPTS